MHNFMFLSTRQMKNVALSLLAVGREGEKRENGEKEK